MVVTAGLKLWEQLLKAVQTVWPLSLGDALMCCQRKACSAALIWDAAQLRDHTTDFLFLFFNLGDIKLNKAYLLKLPAMRKYSNYFS